jgi:RNA polymerase sigma-70 factor, ECF subfamily
LVEAVDNRGEVTSLLADVALGRSDALDRLMSLVYQELRRIARNQMRGERSGHTLQPTALVHEAFLRLVDQNRADWRNRAQFFGVAAQLMRRLLVDHARRRRAAKRGIPVTLNEEICQRGPGADQTEEILAVHQVLGRLAELDPRQARVVELRYFGGLSVEETAEAIGVGTRTVKLDWAMAKGWLKSQLSVGARV